MKILLTRHIKHHTIFMFMVRHILLGNLWQKPIFKDAISCVFDDKSAQAVESIYLSNNTVSRRIGNIAEDIENECVLKLSWLICSPPVFLWKWSETMMCSIPNHLQPVSSCYDSCISP